MRAVTPLFLLLAACDRGPELPTAAENRALDEAANMLDSAPQALDSENNAAGPRNEAQP